MITPSYLYPGDTVGIIAPARKIREEEISSFLEVLNSWGLRYKTGKYLYGKHFQYSGTDRERATDFQQMIDDPEIKAVICVRGGYGSVRIIRYIDFSGFQRNPKACKSYDLQAFLFFVISIHINKYRKKCELNGEFIYILSLNSPERVNCMFVKW